MRAAKGATDASLEDATLRVDGVSVSYGGSAPAVRQVSLAVPPGRIVTLLGPNGAGKSTVVKAIVGLLGYDKGAIVEGTIHYRNVDLGRTPPERTVQLGVSLVPEGRRVFGHLTVVENLLVGGYRKPAAEARRGAEEFLDRFDALGRRRDHQAGLLSGGEQQLLALGRALMADPRLLLLDEPSLGLAPMAIDLVYAAVVELTSERGLSVLLVEQNAWKALRIASYAYVLEAGRVVAEGSASELRDQSDIARLYLGHGAVEAAPVVRERNWVG